MDVEINTSILNDNVTPRLFMDVICANVYSDDVYFESAYIFRLYWIISLIDFLFSLIFHPWKGAFFLKETSSYRI